MNKFLLAMKAMSRGIVVEIDGYPFAMGENGRIGTVAERNGEKVVLECDQPVNWFLEHCESMSDEQTVSLMFSSGTERMKDGREKEIAEQ